jgi:hypothetical protein
MLPGRRASRVASVTFAVATFALLLTAALQTHAAPDSEYQVKAVFLFHFTQFVQWPRNAFADRNAPLIIGVLGEDPFGEYLDQTVQGETVDGRPIAVRRYSRPEDIGEVHVLFISASENDNLESTLAQLQGRSILTVADGEGFAERGVMVRLRTAQNRIRLRINVASVREAGLSVSSKLLRAAEIVTSDSDSGSGSGASAP